MCLFTTVLSSLLFGQISCLQHRPGTLTRLGNAQPSLDSISSCGQKETHPTAPSMQVHWCLQFGRKISPFWYILLLYSHVLPSNFAKFEKQGRNEMKRKAYKRSHKIQNTEVTVPRQTPLTEPCPPPKLHSSPFVWSHGCVLLQSSKSCCAQTLQHPQPSSIRLTPAAHLGVFRGHRQSFGHEADT